jgi:signal transduction histidine kinase
MHVGHEVMGERAGPRPVAWAGLRFVDRGPGIPEAERDRAFMPFQRLGDTSSATGVGLGLTVSRGLTEAMGGTLKPEETPGGGLTMAISLPAVPGPGQVSPAWLGKRSISTERAVARAPAQELKPSRPRRPPRSP